MMLRKGGGKRIRMDDSHPESENPMTLEENETHPGEQHALFGEDSPSQVPDLSDSSSVIPAPRGRRGGRGAAKDKGDAPTTRGRRGQQQAPPPLSPPEEPTTGRGRGRRGASIKAPDLGGEDEESLYNMILSGKHSLQTMVDDWIDAYKANQDSTLVRLMQFFISASGCKEKITADMQASMEHATIIRKMTEEFDEDSGEYPLVLSGQQWKKFRSNFCEFLQTLVKQCQYSIIYDDKLMDNIITLLSGLSDSQVRAFRHTATLAAMKLMTALVDAALTVSTNLDNTQRQYESERQKENGKRATERLQNLMRKRQKLEENMDEIKTMLTYIFQSVFVHRYRDTLPEIRAICIGEIGVWMKKFHQNFLSDSYLKYIGWTLYDKVGEVRLKCLQALQPLYASEELKGKLELFTSKFKDRIVAMTLDDEYDVAVEAVKLVISIHKFHREILMDKDSEIVYELVYCSHRALAQAAGEFLNEKFFVVDERLVENLRTARGKQRQANTPLIRDLLQFFIESKLPEHGAYLVDSLIESNAMMKDWECMTDLLLEDPGPGEEPLDDKQETSLIEIMVCAVRQRATGEPPIGRGPTRKILSAKELKKVSDDKNRLTEHFIRTLPVLLNKYKADSDKIANLLALPQFFALEIYTTSRQEKSLELLLECIKEITDEHTEVDVLEVAAKTLEIICCDDARKSTRTKVGLMNVLESIWNRVSTSLHVYDSAFLEGAELNDDVIFNLQMSLRKISVFYACHSFNKWDVWEKLFRIIRATCDEKRAYPNVAVKYAISACYFALLWDLRNIQRKGEHGVSGTDDIPKLHRKLNDYMLTMKHLVSTKCHTSVFREEAYTSICDGLMVFCQQLTTQKWMEILVYEPDDQLQDLLNEFMLATVFLESREDLDEHARIEMLHKMRGYLAQFCKLVIYNVIPTRAAADVFKFYVKHYNEYGDIIKATLGEARESNNVNCALTIVMSLTRLFNDLPKVGNSWMVYRGSDDFVALKDLTKRFALSFGLDAAKNRDAITALHREGILFSVNPLENPNDPTGPPPNLGFLEIIREFTNKLLKQDKSVVLQYLDHRVGSATSSSQGTDWQPLYAYRNSLNEECDHPPPTTERANTRKRQAVDEV